MTTRVRHWLTGWTLRRRLVVSTVALLVVISAVIGVVSVVALRHSLIGRLDDELASASQRAADAPPRGEGDHVPLFPLGQGEGTLGARIDGTTLTAGYLDSNGHPQDVPTSDYDELTSLPVDGEPHSLSLGDLGDYRLVATHAETGEIVVTGLPLDAVQSTVYQLTAVIVGVAIVGIAIAAAAATLIIRLTLRPLRRVASTAAQVTGLELARGEVELPMRVPATDTDQRTEVGQVGAALDQLLGHVGDALRARQASESRVRKFVADASHELRTPLASIRGYAELTRRDRKELPPEIAHAIGRVESEATRMSALVDDLLLLARLDAGRPLERESVDLSRILVDAVSDAHAAGRRHRWELDLPEEPVYVVGDAQRLHQVVANLLANARTHTPPGTTVRISLATEANRAQLSVIDDGPGISADTMPEVFERFARGDSSRSRAAGGTGLGLAIVAAVVDAHDGAVTVRSRPGETRFDVQLPLVRSAADESVLATVH